MQAVWNKDKMVIKLVWIWEKMKVMNTQVMSWDNLVEEKVMT